MPSISFRICGLSDVSTNHLSGRAAGACHIPLVQMNIFYHIFLLKDKRKTNHVWYRMIPGLENSVNTHAHKTQVDKFFLEKRILSVVSQDSHLHRYSHGKAAASRSSSLFLFSVMESSCSSRDLLRTPRNKGQPDRIWRLSLIHVEECMNCKHDKLWILQFWILRMRFIYC